MSRRLRSVLPTTVEQLKPQVTDCDKIRADLKLAKSKQKLYHDTQARPLRPLEVGDPVRVQLGKAWKQGTVTEKHGQRSYSVYTEDGSNLRRNRRHFIKTNETPGLDYDPPEISEPLTTLENPPDNPTVEPATVVPPGSNMGKAISPYVTRSGRVVKAKIIESV